MIEVRFFRESGGVEPVREWLLAECTKEDRKTVGEDVRFIQARWPVSLPRCRALGDGLFEVRSDLPGHRTARVMFCFDDQHIVLLHAFIKKSQKTPPGDLAVARERKRKLQR